MVKAGREGTAFGAADRSALQRHIGGAPSRCTRLADSQAHGTMTRGFGILSSSAAPAPLFGSLQAWGKLERTDRPQGA